MKEKIEGQRATYVVESLGDNGAVKITMTGHAKYKDQSWIATDENFRDNIEKIESGKLMLLERRE